MEGPFRLVRGSSHRVELTRNGITLSFRRLTGIGVVRALRRGERGEGPVPLGDAGRFRSDPATLRVRALLAMDAVAFRPGAVPEDVRRAYWQTANRGDYQALVAEDGATAAFAIVGKPRQADPAAFRRAVKAIPSLPPIHVRITVPPDATLQYGSRILYAQWRDLALGPQLVPTRAPADA